MEGGVRKEVVWKERWGKKGARYYYTGKPGGPSVATFDLLFIYGYRESQKSTLALVLITGNHHLKPLPAGSWHSCSSCHRSGTAAVLGSISVTDLEERLYSAPFPATDLEQQLYSGQSL